tara:strand:- start:1754 stop:2350 length:597 start_codon:yes stop_codon:yes gene_type:complete
MTYGINGPRGLQPVNSGNGVTWNGQTNEYVLPATGGQSMFQGDPVTLSTAGTIIRGSASNPSLGVFQGTKYQDTQGVWQFTNYFAGATAYLAGNTPVAMIIDDPNAQYTVQETDAGGASGTPLTQAAVGNNIDMLYTAGDTRTGMSAVSINNASIATTLVDNFKVVALDTQTENVIGAFANWIVQINNGVFKTGSTRP